MSAPATRRRHLRLVSPDSPPPSSQRYRGRRCHLCDGPCSYEVEPAFGELPAVLDDDVWTVVMRNGLAVDACHACWAMWPDDFKRFPEVGYGRTGEPVDVVAVLRETAP